MRSYRSSLLGDADDSIPTTEEVMPDKPESILPISQQFSDLADAAEAAFGVLRDREIARRAAEVAFAVASQERDSAHESAENAKNAMLDFLNGLVP